MIYSGESFYFDSEEIEEIIQHYIDKHDYVKALDVVNYGFKFHPFSTELKLSKADLLFAMGDHAGALSILDLLETIEINNADLFMIKGAIYSDLDDSDTAIKYFHLCLEFASEGLTDIYLDLAHEYQNCLNFEQSIVYFSLALESDPDNEFAICELAFCFEEAKKYSEAIAFFHKLTDDNPYNEFVWFYLGIFYSIEIDYKNAIDAFDYALAIDEDYAQAHYEKAQANFHLKEYNKAIDGFSDTLNLDEEYFNAYLFLGRCYCQLDNESKALASYSKAIKINNKLDIAWLEMALMLKNNNKYIDAIYHVKKATQTNDKNPDNWLAYAQLYQHIGMLEDSVFGFNKLISICPEEIEYWLEYSDMLFVNEYFLDCIEVIDIAITVNPKSAELYYKKAAFFLSNGLNIEAEKILEQALHLDFNMHKKLFEYLPQSKNNIFVAELISSYIQP